MFKRILVPLDGSAFAERAIPHAEQFARIFGADLILLRVLDVSSPQDSAAAVDPLKWQIRKPDAELYLKELAEKIQKQLSNYPDINDGGDKFWKSRFKYIIRE